METCSQNAELNRVYNKKWIPAGYTGSKERSLQTSQSKQFLSHGKWKGQRVERSRKDWVDSGSFKLRLATHAGKNRSLRV